MKSPKEAQIKSTLICSMTSRAFFVRVTPNFVIACAIAAYFSVSAPLSRHLWRLSRHFAHYGRSSPLTMYKLLKANSTLSWAAFLHSPSLSFCAASPN